MPHSDTLDLTQEPFAASLLNDEQKERLGEILDGYLMALENGDPPNDAQLAAEHPDLAEVLRAYFRSIEQLHCAALEIDPNRTVGGKEGEPPPGKILPTDSNRLGDFLLGNEIGRGGMGIVYEAYQISLDRRVAVKLLPFASVLNPKQIARFKSEAQAAAQILHPNIVPVFAIGMDRGVHYYRWATAGSGDYRATRNAAAANGRECHVVATRSISKRGPSLTTK